MKPNWIANYSLLFFK